MKTAAGGSPEIWRERAQALARRIPRNALHPRTLAVIATASTDRPIVIACSGGADSVALALLLWAHFPDRRGRWLIAHFNHDLRGADSDADAAFVDELARGLGELNAIRKWRRRGRGGHVSEATARRARWAFLEAAAKKHGAALIATGHQADDVAESMLMRLTRGAGAGGLASPRPVQAVAGKVTRLRPLLDLSSGQIRGALRQARVPWREDQTNFADSYFRNRVRQRVLPALTKASPQDILSGMSTARALLEEDAFALEAIAERVARSFEGSDAWNLTAVRRQPVAILRRVVLRFLASHGLADTLRRAAVERLVLAIQERKTLRLSAGKFEVLVEPKTLRLRTVERRKRPANYAAQTAIPGRKLSLATGGWLLARRRRLSTALRRRILAGEFAPSESVFLSVSGPKMPEIVVRRWRPGDRYRPLGAPGRQKIQDMFVNRKIPQEQRLIRPVVCLAESGPVWVPGIPPAQELAIQPETKVVVQLTYYPPGPMVNGSK